MALEAPLALEMFNEVWQATSRDCNVECRALEQMFPLSADSHSPFQKQLCLDFDTKCPTSNLGFPLVSLAFNMSCIQTSILMCRSLGPQFVMLFGEVLDSRVYDLAGGSSWLGMGTCECLVPGSFLSLSLLPVHGEINSFLLLLTPHNALLSCHGLRINGDCFRISE